MWAAVLDAGQPAALASHTALEVHGFKTFAREAERLHLIIERGAKVTEHPMIVVHESRRLKPEYHVKVAGLPCTQVPRSAIDAAAWQPRPRFACALVAAVVQQRLCTVNELEDALAYVGRVRHKAYLREALRDIRGGSEALSEIDLVRSAIDSVCRSLTGKSNEVIAMVVSAISTPNGSLQMVAAWFLRSMAPTTSRLRAGKPTCFASEQSLSVVPRYCGRHPLSFASSRSR
jgi:hypothetical protein